MCRSVTLTALACLAGCAQYEFDLVEPADLLQRISSASPATITLDELEYQFQAADGRLVIIVVNQSGAATELVGPKSYVVDPGLQSHSLDSCTIASGSHIKLILPPLRPAFRRQAVFGVGIGLGPRRYDPYWPYAPGYGNTFEEPYADGPLALSTTGQQDYWTWNGEGVVRLRLAYRRDDRVFHHDFTFRRRKI